MLRLILQTTAIVLATLSVSAQSMEEKYKALIDGNDETRQLQFLQEWETRYPNDAEMLSAYFNYYADESISTHDSKKSKTIINKALEYADRGINLYPSRLDMRFGKANFLYQLSNYPKHVETIIETLKYSTKNQCNWLWFDNKPIENGLETMIDGMQGYILQLYESRDVNKIKDMLNIAETTFDFYPNDTGSMLNLAIIYILTNQYNEALEILKEAETVSPTDIRVLGNIAETYTKSGDLVNARKYYHRIEEVGDTKAKSYARQQIEKINKEKNK